MQLFKRDLLLHYRNPQEWLNPLAFFVLITILFPLVTSVTHHALTIMGPGIIWIAALFANILSLPQLFLEDYQDGTLEQILLMPSSLMAAVSQKLLAHFIMFGVPLLLIT